MRDTDSTYEIQQQDLKQIIASHEDSKRIECPYCVGSLGYVVSTCEDCCGSGEIKK